MLGLFINIMQQLNKVKSQQLIDRLFNNNVRQNYYEHHNMPARSTHKNFYKTTNSSLKDLRNSKQKSSTIGRQLYPQIPKKIQDPGPGTYDWSFNETKSFKFRNNSNINRKIFSVRSRQHRLGPGVYQYQKVIESNILSKNKRTLVATMNRSPQKQQRLKYTINDNPGPGRYDNSSNINKISNYSEPSYHKISVTARSSIIRNDKLPGPGYYRWDQFFNKNKQKKKPLIQYKFVYGHPS